MREQHAWNTARHYDLRHSPVLTFIESSARQCVAASRFVVISCLQNGSAQE
jgi:hypothetical protein